MVGLLVLVVLAGAAGVVHHDRRRGDHAVNVMTEPDVAGGGTATPTTASSWSEARDISPGQGVAVWPRADRDALVAESQRRADAGHPLPKDPSALALVFAREVLRWSDPRVVTAAPKVEVGWEVQLSNGPEGAPPAEVWVVGLAGTDDLGVEYFNLDWHDGMNLGINMFEDGSSDAVSSNASIPGTTAELTVRYGDHALIRAADDREARWSFSFGPDPGLPGSLWVILRDGTGAAVQAIGTALPAGPFAAS
jgi:hypothetical protein